MGCDFPSFPTFAHQPPPRAYPRGLGKSIHQVYDQQLRSPAHGDLRVQVACDPHKSEAQLFMEMELGDTWEEGELKPVFDFMMRCKHTRLAYDVHAQKQIVDLTLRHGCTNP